MTGHLAGAMSGEALVPFIFIRASERPEVEEKVWVLAVTISLPVTSSLSVDIVLLLARRTCLLLYHVLMCSNRTEQHRSVSKTRLLLQGHLCQKGCVTQE